MTSAPSYPHYRAPRRIPITSPRGQGLDLGGSGFTVIAGPCSVEDRETMLTTAQSLRELGILALRGGIHKLRTHPESFQGFGEQVLGLIEEIRQSFDLLFVSEITDPRHIPLLSAVVDVFQVGSRNMYNYPLLQALGDTGKPVLLKRAFSATLDEWLGAARYIEKTGNFSVILCERGIRGFDPSLRNVLDLGTVAWLRTETDYPVYVDPSHAAGRRDLVLPLAQAARAVGASGLLLEAHPNPDAALSDAKQTISLSDLRNVLR